MCRHRCTGKRLALREQMHKVFDLIRVRKNKNIPGCVPTHQNKEPYEKNNFLHAHIA